MSAPALRVRVPPYGIITTVDPSIAPPRKARYVSASVIEAVIPYDPVLDCGPVRFKVARRVDPSLLSFIARPLYRLFVRALPRWWPSRPDSTKVPPAPKAELGIYDNDKWWEAVNECKTPDHQINVMPANRLWPYETVTYQERACRPRDLSDPRNAAVFRALCKMYGGGSSMAMSPVCSTSRADQVIKMLHRIETALLDINERLRRVEEREDAISDT